jgi:hypothetical protein
MKIRFMKKCEPLLYGPETWSLTLKEENSLRIYENGLLRGMFGPKRQKMKGAWEELLYQDIHNVSSPNVQGG